MIQKTTDYNMFKKHECNVSLQETNVIRIMNSIKAKNLLSFRPILVDNEMKVIDGQHRLEAAKRLGVPIYYDIREDLAAEDMRLLNENMRLWGRKEYLDHFCAQGKEDYIKLKRFCEKHNLTLPNAFSALGLGTSQVGKGKNRDVHVFKTGNFKFPSSENEKESEEILEKTNRIIEYLLPKLPRPNSYISGPSMRRAFYLFLSIKSVDVDVLLNKLSYRLDMVYPASRLSDSLNMLKNIYNWKSKNPIEIDEIL